MLPCCACTVVHRWEWLPPALPQAADMPAGGGGALPPDDSSVADSIRRNGSGGPSTVIGEDPLVATQCEDCGSLFRPTDTRYEKRHRGAASARPRPTVMWWRRLAVMGSAEARQRPSRWAGWAPRGLGGGGYCKSAAKSGGLPGGYLQIGATSLCDLWI
jgi:hypothetical protein